MTKRLEAIYQNGLAELDAIPEEQGKKPAHLCHARNCYKEKREGHWFCAYHLYNEPLINECTVAPLSTRRSYG